LEIQINQNVVEMQKDLRDRLWRELTQSKYNDCYACIVLRKQRTMAKWLNVIVLAFSTAGIMGWPFWKQLPLVSCIIVAAISLVKLLSPHFIASEKEIIKLQKVIDFYSDYHHNMQRLWYDQSTTSDEVLKKKMLKIIDTQLRINATVDEVINGTNAKVQEEADQKTRIYLKNTFNV